MKHLKIAGLCLMAMFAISMVASATASAAPTWWQCREEHGSGVKYTNSTCTVESTEGQWEWKQLETREESRSRSKGNLKLIDKEATGGESEIECNGTDVGSIGAGNKDEITAITANECKRVKGLCEAGGETTAKAIDLPWTTELLEEPAGSGKIRDKITAAGKGPGYKVECTVGGFFKVADECFGTTNTLMRNDEANGTVEAEFEKESPKGECSLSKKKSGEVLGIDVIEQLSGHYTQVRLN
jgi:hypothetical protein